jgi:hypothetical protein
MPNIWKDTAAPYVLVTALGATGWIVNTAVTDLKQLRLVEYEVRDDDSNGKLFKFVDVYNKSASFSLLEGDFHFYCESGLEANCFGSNGRNGTPVSSSPLTGASLKTEVFSDSNSFRAEARLLAQSATRFTVNVSDKKHRLAIFYVPKEGSEATAGNVVFREGRSWEGWLIANYLTSLIWTFLALGVFFISWCTLAFWAFLFGKSGSDPAPKQPERIYVVLGKGGVADDKDT